MSAEVIVHAKPPLWTECLARVSGLWILLGCAAKALVGTPGDLPKIVRELPLAVGTTFGLVIGIEAFVGLTMLLRPARAWPLATLLLLTFAGVLSTQIAAGAASCGCFGATMKVPPASMLSADVAALALLFAARPWRLARGGFADVAVFGAALCVAIAVPMLLDREAKPGGAGGGPTTIRKWAHLDFDAWTGKKVAEIDLAKWLDLTNAADGVWYFYRESCGVCALCLQRVTLLELGARDVTLVRIPESGEEAKQRAVHALPTGAFVHTLVLPSTVDWNIGAPAKVVVEGGVVKSARQDLAPDDCP